MADPRGASNAISNNVAPNGPFVYDTTTNQVQVRPLFYAMVSECFESLKPKQKLCFSEPK